VISISRTSGKVNRLLWNEAAQDASDVIWIARDGSPRIRLALQTSIYTNYPGFWPEVRDVDVSTGKSHIVVKGREDVMSYYADAAGTVRMGYGFNDGNQTARLLYRDRDGDMFHIIDRADAAKHETVTVPNIFLPDPGQALVTSDKDGFDAVYRYDIRQQKLGERVFGTNGYDVGGLIDTPNGDGLAGISLTDDRSHIQWIDPKLAQVQTDIDKAVGADNARVISWSRDQQRLIVFVGTPDRAGAYYYYNIGVGRMQFLGWANVQLKATRLGPVSTVRYKARDGLEIAAVLTLPRDKQAKALPLIVMPHGGPEARDDEEWDWWAQFLADHGYAVIQPNYRGSTGYGSTFLKKGEGQWGLAMQDDLLDAVSYLAGQGIADPKRTCIVGGSYGGYAAMRGAERDGATYRCAVSFAGISDLSAMRRYDRKFLNANAASRGWKESAPDFDAVSPISHPEMFTIPILLMHGKKDLRVPIAQSRNLAAKLRAAGKTVRYVEQPEGDHHFSREADRLQFLREMETFLNQYNPA
jgi:dipeptidyl aminopeptidase/acylaminoacyl peptidase